MNSDRLSILLGQLQSEGNDPFILYGIAMEYMSSQDFDMAAEYLIKNMEEFPDYVPTYYQLGVCLDEMDEVEKAISVMKIGRKIAISSNDEKAVSELSSYIQNLEME